MYDEANTEANTKEDDMIARFGLLASLLALVLMIAGCIVHTPGRVHHRGSTVRSCAPGYYWDGHRCRHRGRRHHHRRY